MTPRELVGRAPKPVATIHLPVTFSDGGIGWLEMRYAPLADELEWALSESETMREAFAVLAVTKARAAVASGTDATVGWESA